MDQQLTIEISSPGNERIIRLAGAFTLGNIFDFQTKFREGAPTDTVLDVTDVSYIDSAGIGCVVNAFVSCKNAAKRFTLVGPNERVRAVLGYTQVDKILPIVATMAEVKA